MGWKNNRLVLLVPAKLNCWGSILQAQEEESQHVSCLFVMLFGRMEYKASCICRAAVLHRDQCLWVASVRARDALWCDPSAEKSIRAPET